ncbi:MAG: sigma-70 family RNA polymerase sigma factor [bacterium]|nr:sigma-70 family RNA polymerase sigma factor [bacterium]
MNIDVESLYRRYAPMVIRRCRVLLGSDEEARDAMQEVFVKLHVNRAKLTATYPSGLLYRMATNICLNKIRERNKFQTIDETDLLTSIALSEEKEEVVIRRNLLDQLFKREKPSTRVIAVMLFVDGFTLKEVALSTGLSVSGVRKRMREFKDRIQTHYKEVFNDY